MARKTTQGRLRVALVYPNEYRAGMANLGLHIIYDLLNSLPYAYCERFFYGYSRSLETGTALKAFDLILFSWQFELDALNMLSMLSRAGIPLRREGREEFVMVGGPCAVNPSPLEGYVDAFFIGEAEEKLVEFVALFKKLSRPKQEVEALAMEGTYLPQLRNRARRVFVRDLDAYYPTAQVMSPASTYGEAFLLEVSRGCSRGCRFCMGGYIFRPRRERSLERIEGIVEEGMRLNAPQRVVLLGASVTDYSRLEGLSSLMAGWGKRVSVPSLRAESVTYNFLETLASLGQKSITIAPENCFMLRKALNKPTPDTRILEVARKARRAGIKNLKMYFILGLPGEEEGHIEEIASLVKDIKGESGLRLRVSVNPLVPKPHSAMQWAPLVDGERYRARVKELRRELQGVAEVRAESHRLSLFQTLISRGDKRIGRVLEEVGESRSLSTWKRAMKRHNLSFEGYTGEKAIDTLPWDKIDTRINPSFLSREYKKYYQSEISG